MCQFDGGSTDNFILNSLASDLQLKYNPIKLNLTRVGLPENIFHTREYYLNIKDKFGNIFTISCFGVPSLSKQEELSPDIYKKCAELFNVSFSEINENHGEVSLLLGANCLGCFPSIVKICGDLALAKARFGQRKYIIFGKIPTYKSVNCNMVDIKSLEYWSSIDQLGINAPPMCSTCLRAPACKQCKALAQPASFLEQEEAKIIRQCMTFDYEGKQVLATFPFLKNKDPRKIFPPSSSNYLTAKRMAFNVMRSLKRDNELDIYNEVFAEQIQRGVLREVTEEEMKNYERLGNPVNYCSHHPVKKYSSLSTRTRSVINSSLNHNGTNLNEILCKGPKALSNMLHVLFKFSFHPFISIMDLKKAYNRIKQNGLVEQHLRRIIWFKNFDKLINGEPETVTYVVTKAAFGDKCSSFYLELVKEEVAKYIEHTLDKPKYADSLRSSSYVDDYLGAFNTLEEASEAVRVLEQGFEVLGFEFKEAVTNGPGVKLEPRDPETILGYLYHFNKDQIQIKFKVNFSKKKRSERTEPDLKLGDDISKIILTPSLWLTLMQSQYDPKGLGSPFLAKLKIGFSRICKKSGGKLDFKRPLDEEFQKIGLKIIKEILNANQDPILFDRSNCPNGYQLSRLVAFCDSSAICLQAVIYGVFQCKKTNKIHTSLIAGKTSIVHNSIPKNEMMSIVAANRLVQSYVTGVNCQLDQVEIDFLSDSQVSLDMLNPAYVPKDIFSQHKIAEILKSINIIAAKKINYYHCDTKFNIADYGTKENTPIEFLRSELWQYGPKFIRNLEGNPDIVKLVRSFSSEQKVICNLNSIIFEEKGNYEQLVHNLSSFRRVLRVCLLIRRIFKNKSFRVQIQNVKYTNEEQRQAFLDLVKSEQTGQQVNKNTKQLMIFQDKDGVYYTKQRATEEAMLNLFSTNKLPVLAPGRLSELLIHHHHTSNVVKNLHCHHNQKQTMANTRCGTFATYIVFCKQQVRKICSRCVTCRRVNQKEQQAVMDARKGGIGEPPAADGSSFVHIALDYSGPYPCHPPNSRETRGNKNYKIWAMVVLDQQTRAVNILPVERYDTDSFLTAFKIHCNMRGSPVSVLSDPMTAFVGASSVLDPDDLMNKIRGTFHVDWKFIPSASQWRDPVERTIRTISGMLKSINTHNNNVPLTLNEYYLLFSNISEIMNRQPLKAYIEDEEIKFISANSLMMGRGCKDPPALSQNTELNIRARQKLIEEKTNQFWKELESELCNSPSMFKTARWYNTPRDPKKGDILLILYKNNVGTGYRYGRIAEEPSSVRTLEVDVSPIQDGKAIKDMKQTTRMTVPIQRTVFLCSENGCEDEK